MRMDDVLFADRSDRAKLRFTGAQAAWFLHQVLTQSFEDMAPGEARDAALITAHGRMTGYLEVLATDDSFLAHFERELVATLPDVLRRYVFATQVEIEDVTNAMGLLLVTGDGAGEAANVIEASLVHPTTSLGTDAVYLWLPRHGVEEALLRLEKEGARQVAEGELEAIRIANGVPRWGFEMDDKTLPQEAGIDEHAVHYHKGCYLGQEAMAKIHFRGKVNRRVAKLHADRSLERGTELFADATRVGLVTSAAGNRGLALVKQSVEAGSTVDADGAAARVVS